MLTALQQGAIDGAVASTAVFTAFHYQDAAKYATETGQPAIFGTVEISKKWYDTLPPDLRGVLDQTAAKKTVAVDPQATEITENSRKVWTAGGGDLISLPPDEQAALLKLLSTVGEDVSKTKPLLSSAYQIVSAAAQRTKQPKRLAKLSPRREPRQSVTEGNSARRFGEIAVCLCPRHGEARRCLDAARALPTREDIMITIKQGRIARAIVAAGAFGTALALHLGAAQAQDKTYEMKISTPTINDTPDTFAGNLLAAVKGDSGGRIKGEVYPASQLARSRDRSRARNSAPSNVKSCRRNSWSASIRVSS